MKIHSLLLSLLLVLGLGAVAAQDPEDEAPRLPVTVFVLRHAEKAVSPTGSDPGLTAAGEQRAAALARLLAVAGVTHLYASEFARTRATLAPLAAALHLEVTVLPAREPERLLEALHALPPGSVAVVAGHSNTVPRIVEGLGGEVRDLVEVPPYGTVLAEETHGRLFLVTLPIGEGIAPRTIELRYGD